MDHIGTCLSAVSWRGPETGFGKGIQKVLNAVLIVLAGMLASGWFWSGRPSTSS
jgi:hypothetical protein